MAKDKVLAEIDEELRAINVKLKKVLSKTNVLLDEPVGKPQEIKNDEDGQQE